MKRPISLGLFAVLIAAAGFTGGWLAAVSRPVPSPSQAEVPPPSPVEESLKAHPLWEMRLGLQRVYVDGDRKETATVKAIRIDQEKSIYTLVITDEQDNVRYENVFQNAEGVWYVNGNPEFTDRWDCRLKFSSRAGDKWPSNQTWDTGGLEYTCRGAETVIVPAGTFETVKVTITMFHAGTGTTRNEAYWYSVEHGLIQYEIRLDGIQSPGVPFGTTSTRSLFKLASAR